MNKLSVKNLDVAGKRVLCRVDYNVPIEAGKVGDAKRISASLDTVRLVLEKGGRIILMSHLGRPKGKPTPEFSMKPVAEELAKLLGKPVVFAPDCVGADAEAKSKALKNGEVMLLENLRFYAEEEKNDAGFSAKLAKLGDVYVNDAFGTAHRAHASTAGVVEHFKGKAASGLLMAKELEYLGAAVLNPKRPFVAIMGGAKVEDKIPVIQNLLGKVDKLLVGGGMMYTFYKAQGMEIGNSLLDKASLGFVGEMVQQHKGKLVLPTDTVVTDKLDFEGRKVGQLKTVPVNAIPAGWLGVDIGPATAEAFGREIMAAKTVVWNGPMGVFEIEATSKGTFEVANRLAQATEKGTVTVIGGGDSASAVKKAGLSKKMTHVSTGGGASMEFLEGKELPGVAVLTDA